MAQQFNRPPRLQPILPQQIIEVPNPPEPLATQVTRQVVQAAVPLVTILGYMIVSLTGQGRNRGILVTMAMTAIFTTGLSLWSFVQDRQAARERRLNYLRVLADLRQQMLDEHNNQRVFYEYNYPPMNQITEIAQQKLVSRHGSRLWERRRMDQDFGAIRIGQGSRKSSVEFVMGDTDGAGDDLYQQAKRLVEDALYVENVPITLSLCPRPDEAPNPSVIENQVATHVLGVACTTPQSLPALTSFAQGLVAYYACFHAPEDAQLYIIGAPSAEKRWLWAKKLPHCKGEREILGDRTCFASERLDSEGPTKQAVEEITPSMFWNTLRAELDSRQQQTSDRHAQQDDNAKVVLPHLLLVVDLLDFDEALSRVHTQLAVQTIVESGIALSASLVFVVPNQNSLPSECDGVLEVEAGQVSYHFRYAQTGLNTPRLLGMAENLDPSQLETGFAEILYSYGRKQRRGFHKTITLFDLFGDEIDSVTHLKIAERWKRSKEHAEWLSAPVGVLVNGDLRTLTFSVAGDGVHGLVAGTTGSGKSEFLRTLLAGLAIRYDPSVLNFVLVDYKGGTEFAPYKNMPHCVDIVTNLQGKAVDRMFEAIKAELDRRGAKLARNNVNHIVEYREKGYHLSGDPEKGPFPHLFIVVDEFAEMIRDNPDFKATFDTITRLGRAYGVTLLLATQRPTGFVTDQMRANMKLRACLRVEGIDDSREILGRADAAFLPSSAAGRAYIQSGNDTPLEVQIARTDLEHNESILTEDSIQFGTYKTAPQERSTVKPLISWVVGETREVADQQNIPMQRKPWPDPLPSPLVQTVLEENDKNEIVERQFYAPLLLNGEVDTSYFPGVNEQRSMLNPDVADWITKPSADLWPLDIFADHRRALVSRIGVVDNPRAGQQNWLSILLGEPMVIFGAPASGKTTMLLALAAGLTATHSPNHLHLYGIDLGNKRLHSLDGLPHLGSIIDLTDPDFLPKLNRLLNILDHMIEDRQVIVTEFGSVAQYNRANSQDPYPVVLVMIDNFVELKDHDLLIQRLVRIIASGRSSGIYFAVTANQPGDLARIYNLFTQRFTLKQAEQSMYVDIVGRGVPIFDEVPGRGVFAPERVPLVFQVGIPLESPSSISASDNPDFDKLAENMAVVWSNQKAYPVLNKPQNVELLPNVIPLVFLLNESRQWVGSEEDEMSIPLGRFDRDRRLAVLNVSQITPHLLFIGARFPARRICCGPRY